MKKLYEFTVIKNEEVEETETTTVDGSEVKTTKKVKKDVLHKFFIRKPNRILSDEGQLFYSASVSEFIKRGLMTRAMLAKRYSEDNGIWSDTDKQEYARLYIQLFAIEEELKKLAAEDETLIKEKQAIRENVIGKIRKFEQTQINLFDETAEIKARDKTILWWVLNIAYDEKDKPFFGEGDFTAKLKRLDDIEENEDVYLTKIVRKFSYLIGFWFVGACSSKQDFDKFNNDFEVASAKSVQG